MKATINSNFGIKNCADCENNIRCEQCVYNKKSIEEVYKEIRKETAKEILDELLNEENLENVYFTNKNGDIRDRQVIRIEKIKDLAKQYGIEVDE